MTLEPVNQMNQWMVGVISVVIMYEQQRRAHLNATSSEVRLATSERAVTRDVLRHLLIGAAPAGNC